MRNRAGQRQMPTEKKQVLSDQMKPLSTGSKGKGEKGKAVLQHSIQRQSRRRWSHSTKQKGYFGTRCNTKFHQYTTQHNPTSNLCKQGLSLRCFHYGFYINLNQFWYLYAELHHITLPSCVLKNKMWRKAQNQETPVPLVPLKRTERAQRTSLINHFKYN